jgi:hypothetical protein
MTTDVATGLPRGSAAGLVPLPGGLMHVTGR